MSGFQRPKFLSLYFLNVGLAVILAPVANAQQKPILRAEIETGVLSVIQNDVRIPGKGGTRFSLADLQGRDLTPFFRLNFSYEGATGTGWRLLYAPLERTARGRLTAPVNFKGNTFDTASDTEALYKFNSYRLSWRNRWKQGSNSDWRIGATLKIRDAEIALRQGTAKESEADVGLVPLLHIYGEEKLSPKLSFVVDFDGLAAPQGRAFDLGLKFQFQTSTFGSFQLGFRVLEGGASNDRVYSFATVRYAVIGYATRF